MMRCPGAWVVELADGTYRHIHSIAMLRRAHLPVEVVVVDDPRSHHRYHPHVVHARYHLSLPVLLHFRSLLDWAFSSSPVCSPIQSSRDDGM
jgi:hypothetical protein